MKQIILTQNDKNISIIVNFKENGTIKDINGFTVNVDIVTPESSVLSDIAHFVDASKGQAEFFITEKYTATAGLYKLYFRLVDSNGVLTGQNMVTFYVLEKNGGVQ